MDAIRERLRDYGDGVACGTDWYNMGEEKREDRRVGMSRQESETSREMRGLPSSLASNTTSGHDSPLKIANFVDPQACRLSPLTSAMSIEDERKKKRSLSNSHHCLRCLPSGILVYLKEGVCYCVYHWSLDAMDPSGCRSPRRKPSARKAMRSTLIGSLLSSASIMAIFTTDDGPIIVLTCTGLFRSLSTRLFCAIVGGCSNIILSRTLLTFQPLEPRGSLLPESRTMR
jgi:hypothetical protein